MMSKAIPVFIFLLLEVFSIRLYSQHTPTDINPADTVRAMHFVQKAFDAINQSSADSAKWYAKQAIHISEKCGFRKGVAWGYHRLSQIFDYTGLPDSALIFGKRAENIFREAGDDYGLARSLYTMGNIYLYKSWYETALKYYTGSHDVFSNSNNLSGTNDCYAGIALVYYFRKDWQKCIHYLTLTATYEKLTNDDEGLPETYFNLGCTYYELGLHDSAEHFYKLAESIAEKNNNNRVLTATSNNLGEIALDKNKYATAIRYFTRSVTLKNQLGYYEGLGENYINLGKVYMEAGDYLKAEGYIKDGIGYCRRYHASEDLAAGYLVLSQLEEKKGDHAAALSVYKQYVKENDTLNKMRFAGQVAEWQTLYHLKDQEFQLESFKTKLTVQQADMRRNQILLVCLIAITLVIILAFYLLYRNIRNKNTIAKQNIEIQKHRIKQLENEKLLLATQSVLKGEETERRRLARDLHDGLGGLLSGAKIAFNNIKSNSSDSNCADEEFVHALGLLDTSINELRRIARNLLPETLVKLGLKSSIEDFCSEIGRMNPLHIIFQFFGTFERVDSNLELNAFRVIQELVNNTVKHANATQLLVQMLQEPDRLCFVVQDNGTGFNIHNEPVLKGIGLSTIRSRVDALNGKMEMITTPKTGTEFTVEFPVQTHSLKQAIDSRSSQILLNSIQND